METLSENIDSSLNNGKVISIRGSVVDVWFENKLPSIYTSLHSGKEVSLDDVLNGCERILSDEFNDFPESAFYLIGSIDEAKNKENKNTEKDKSDSANKDKSGKEMKIK